MRFKLCYQTEHGSSCITDMDCDTRGQAKGDAIGGTMKGWEARGEDNNGVEYTARQKSLQTSLHLSPYVYVC